MWGVVAITVAEKEGMQIRIRQERGRSAGGWAGRSNRGWAGLPARRVGGAVDQRVGGAVRKEGGPSGRPGERAGRLAALVHLGGSQERGWWQHGSHLHTCRGRALAPPSTSNFY